MAVLRRGGNRGVSDLSASDEHWYTFERPKSTEIAAPRLSEVGWPYGVTSY